MGSRSAATRSSRWPIGRVVSRTSPRPPRSPRPRLAALAHVGPAPGGAQLADRAPADVARLSLAQVHEELVLEAALDAVGVAEVVDRRALGLDPRVQRR